MKAFHGRTEIKETYLARIRAHREADELIHGIYWQDGKGCAVGCTIHSRNHAAYESELGIPAQLAHLEDFLFEHLPNGEAKLWPERFLSAIPVGADLSLVWPKFAVWLLTNKEYGWPDNKHCRAVADLYRRRIAGKVVTEGEFDDAAMAAAGEARAVAEAAAEAAAEAVAAARAARAARAAWADVHQANKLLSLLARAKEAE